MDTRNPSNPDRSAQPFADEFDLAVLAMLAHDATDADAFEREVLGEDASVTMPERIVLRSSRSAQSASGSLWRQAGVAAAACAVMAVGVWGVRVFTNKPVVAPGGTSPVAIETINTIIPGSCEDVPKTVLASNDVDLSSFSQLDPDLLDGLPSLESERSVVLAVFHGQRGACECSAHGGIEWALNRTGDASASEPMATVFGSALGSPCTGDAQGVTLFQITGPRSMLPFGDEDAAKLLACVDPRSTGCSATDEACFQASAGACLPQGLSVRARTVDFAMR